MRYSLYISLLMSLIFFDSGSLISQDLEDTGYIVTQSGDTLIGQVVNFLGKRKYQEVTFITSTQEVDYSATQIKGFMLGGGHLFESDESTGLFWEVLVRGKVSLYKRGTKFFLKDSSGITTLESKDREKVIEGQLVKNRNKAWKNKLAKVTGDCIPDTKVIPNLKFKPYELIEYIEQYNQCSGTEYTTYNYLNREVGIRIGISAAAYQSKSEAQEQLNLQVKGGTGSSQFASAGISLEFFYRNIANRIIFNPEILYYENNVLLTDTEVRQNITLYTDFFSTGKFISTPLNLRYNLNRTFPMNYIAGTFIMNFPIDYELRVLRERDQNDQIMTTALPVDPPPNVFFGGGFVIGRQWKFGDLYGSIEVKYQNIFTSNLNSNFKITNQNIGAGFKLHF